MIIRQAVVDDAREILNIYAPYVRETAITFEYDVPTLMDFRERIRTILKKYPYLVASQDGEIIGYAYLNAFHPREAYQYCAEISIYLKKGVWGQGVGRRLYEALEHIAKAQHIRNIYACIACADQEDEYLTHNSVYFHKHLGFKRIAFFERCGYKFDRWYHMIYMEKILNTDEKVEPLIPYPELQMNDWM